MTEVTEKSHDELSKNEAMEMLEIIGGKTVKDDDISFEGTKLVLPQSMKVVDAIRFLIQHNEQNEEVTSFSKVFNYRPFDGANALDLALKKVFGTSGISKATKSFFGDIPPKMREIKVSINETRQIPWGEISVPMIEGKINSGAAVTETGLCYVLNVECKRKYKSHIQGLFQVIEETLKTSSIYKGKSFNGGEEPDFIDVNGIDEDRIVFSNEVVKQLQANVWSLLEKSERMQELGLPMKRAVLLEGPYGTGKTSAAFITAKKAEKNGWTFIYCRPGVDKLSDVMHTAKLYQPAVVFFEDVDVISETADSDDVTKLLDMFDGINAKGTQLMAVMTTNHVERIHKGMVRPGRLDSIIRIDMLDREGVEKLVRNVVDKKLLDNNTDFDVVFEAMDGYLPAYVKESVERALRYSIASTDSNKNLCIGTNELVDAANGLRRQYGLMHEASEGTKQPSIDSILKECVADVIDGAAFATEMGSKTNSYEASKLDVRKHGNYGTSKQKV